MKDQRRCSARPISQTFSPALPDPHYTPSPPSFLLSPPPATLPTPSLFTGILSHYLYAAQVAAERRQVGSQALLVADVGQHGAEGGQYSGHLGWQREAGAGHEGGQA